MKGVVLAGWLGSLLKPLLKVTNKHLLPVYNQPSDLLSKPNFCKMLFLTT